MRFLPIFFHKNEKWLTPIVLIGGFVLDNFTLRRADLFIENALLSLYFVSLMSAILLWHKLQSKSQKSVRVHELETLLFLAIQFIFGGLFSALTVFYIKSSSLFSSWPFLIILFAGMISTEYFKKHFSQFLVQLSTLYLLLFTYLIVIIPLFTKSINAYVFLISGIVSLLCISIYIFLFKKVVPNLLKGNTIKISYVIGGIFALINTLYFVNAIPPIPLVLQDSGIYKNVVRTDSRYVFAYFESDFSLKSLKTQYTVAPGSNVYFYSSIFAPVKFEQIIVHEWQKKNSQGDWIKVSQITFPIYGGSSTGYRGYSVSTRVTKGEWRILVKTNRGQVLGSKTFIIK